MSEDTNKEVSEISMIVKQLETWNDDPIDGLVHKLVFDGNGYMWLFGQNATVRLKSFLETDKPVVVLFDTVKEIFANSTPDDLDIELKDNQVVIRHNGATHKIAVLNEDFTEQLEATKRPKKEDWNELTQDVADNLLREVPNYCAAKRMTLQVLRFIKFEPKYAYATNGTSGHVCRFNADGFDVEKPFLLFGETLAMAMRFNPVKFTQKKSATVFKCLNGTLVWLKKQPTDQYFNLEEVFENGGRGVLQFKLEKEMVEAVKTATAVGKANLEGLDRFVRFTFDGKKLVISCGNSVHKYSKTFPCKEGKGLSFLVNGNSPILQHETMLCGVENKGNFVLAVKEGRMEALIYIAIPENGAV